MSDLTDCAAPRSFFPGTKNGDRAAGLVAHSKGPVTALGCSNTGEINAAGSDAGGIAGWIEDDDSSFMECSNSGNVSAAVCAGGIFGYFGSDDNDKLMSLIDNINTGNITAASSKAGGIVGQVNVICSKTRDINEMEECNG